MEKNWLAIYTKPRSEKAVADRLEKAGIEIYLPMLETMRQWSDRKKKIKVPLIPSYVFVKVAEVDRIKVLKVPGVMNFIFWLGKPAVIREHEIMQIKYLLKEADSDEVTLENLLPGDKAVITAGQFKDEPVTIISAEKKEYIVILESLGVKLRLSKMKVGKG